MRQADRLSDDEAAGETRTDHAVLFDMDGVILEGWGTDSVVHRRALDDVLDARGLTVDEELYTALAADAYDEAFKKACAAAGVDAPTLFRERDERSAKRIVERLAAGTRGIHRDVDVIEELTAHAPVGLVSNNYHSTVEFVVDHFRLTEFAFARGRDLGPTGYNRRKPDPHYLNEALDALDASTGVYVGDRATDVIAADRAGLDSVFIRREHNAELDLSVEPTAEIERLDELHSVLDV